MRKRRVFDDTELDRSGHLWTQVCRKHKHVAHFRFLDPAVCVGAVCGVKGCTKDASVCGFR